MLAFQGGEDGAFDRIVARYQSSVFHFVVRTVRDEGRAEDLTQEVFVRVYRSRARYRRDASFKTWLFTIASRLTLNELRAVRRRRRVFADGPAGTAAGSSEERGGDGTEDFWANVPEPDAAEPSERAEEEEMKSVIESALAKLPESQRAAIQLQRSESFSYQEIADALETTIPAVKSLLVRARESLKVELERYLSGKNQRMRRNHEP